MKTRILKKDNQFYPEYFEEGKTYNFIIFKWTTKPQWYPFLVPFFRTMLLASFDTLEEAQDFIQKELSDDAKEDVESPAEVVWESR